MARKKEPSALDLARARFAELAGELHRLTVAFPELHEATDDDDLPIRFLLRRGADRARSRAARLREAGARAAAAPKRTTATASKAATRKK